MNVKPLLRRGAFVAAVLVVTPLVAADLSEVADLKPLAMKAYGIRSVERKGDNTLAVTFGASSSAGARRLASAWRVTSPDDPAYAYSKFVKPASVAEVSSEVEFKYPDGMAEQKKAMPSLTRTVVELKLPTPMKKNCKYAAVAYGAEMEVVTSGRTGLYAGEDAVDADLAAAIVGLRRVSSVGEGKLLCEFGAGYSPAGGNSAANWKVTVNGKPRPALALGRRSKIDCYVPKGWGGTYPCLMQHDIFLDIGETLKTGDKVAVEVTDAVSAGARTASFAFDESKSVSRSIQANQVGYLPDAPKFAYVGCWFGSFPDAKFAGGAGARKCANAKLAVSSLAFDAPPQFEIVDEKSGKPVKKGTAKFVFSGNEKESKKTSYAASNVWELDFADVRTPGRYFIRIPGVGRSLSFHVDKAVYEKALKVQALGVYEQRCGIALDPKLTRGWERIACHAGGVVASTCARVKNPEFAPFDKNVVNGADGKPLVLKASGGHHDAGDYNPRSHLDVAQALLNCYELKPTAFTDGQFAVPERGNGIPDIVDEALWQLKLWKGLQDEDGGIRAGTESLRDPGFFQTVELDDTGDYAWAKDSKMSFQCAGAFAQAARILKKCGKAAEAKDFLARAERAYEWGKANPTTGLKDAQDKEYNTDPRAYAAVSLYHTTREKKYHDDFKTIAPWVSNPKAEVSSWGKYDLSLAARQYLLLPKDLVDATLRKTIEEAMFAEFRMFKSGSAKWPYKFLRNPWAPITWGTGAYENYAVTAAHLYALTGDKECREWLVRTCDNTLGANPLGLSWITGLGERTIRCPLHNSRYRAAGGPVIGLQAQGPMQRGHGYSFKETLYPAWKEGEAVLHAFIDSHWAIAMDEPTVNNMANTLLVFGVLSK